MGGSRRSIRVGIVGCGWVTEYRHLPALRRVPGADIVAIADIDEKRLNRVAERFRVPVRHTNFQALLAEPAIEAVAVCTPGASHAAIGLAALEAGKHLFIEKPLALALEDCDRLIERAVGSGRKAMVGLNLRWHRLVREARDIIHRGVLGSLTMASAVLATYHETAPAWRKRREEGGGVLCEQAVHQYDLWRFILNSEVEEVFTTTRAGRWEDETATVSARLTNGMLVVSAFSWGTGNVCYLDIFGERARLQVDCLRFDGLQLLSRAEHPGDLKVRLRRIPSMLSGLAHVPATVRDGGDYLASYREEWRHFLTAIRQGTPVEPTLQDGRRALEVVLAAQESADLGHPVKLAELRRAAVGIRPALSASTTARGRKSG